MSDRLISSLLLLFWCYYESELYAVPDEWFNQAVLTSPFWDRLADYERSDYCPYLMIGITYVTIF